MIITLEEYKQFAGKTKSDKDNSLQPLVDMANDYIEKFCNTKFEPIVVVGKRITQMDNIIMLPEVPALSVEAVSIIRSADQTDTLDPVQYMVDLGTSIIEIIDPTVVLPKNPYSFSIDYTHGYNVPPSSVILAAFELVRHYEKREFNKQKDMGNGQQIDFTETTVIPTQVRSLLDTYRVL